MNQKSKIVFTGFINLSQEEQKEVLQELDKLADKHLVEKVQIRKDLLEYTRKIVSGPLGETCPCCGR